MARWPLDKIQCLITEAEQLGESEVELASPKEAKLFRYAINNHRKKNHGISRNVTSHVIGQRVVVRLRQSIVTLTRSVAEVLAEEEVEP